ncbi:uncharacterized protein LOC132724375 [Ruditapes philippinarum]|uniref:uncharacterized protein LOC132724375 n=1 Tax=Ruditapes philippinarum TaxID=129788 RepID=UPI00295A5C4A|nr:uncharacterized protein LOC132724375 [Ruditapes philippinarum]
MIRSLSTLPYRAATLHRYTTTKMKRIVPIGFVLFGFILLNIKVAECITCLRCENVADLSNCKKAIVCNANETCYIEKILSPVDFKPVYNTGCKALEYCNLQLCNKNAYGDGNSRKKQDQRTTSHNVLNVTRFMKEDHSVQQLKIVT